MDLTGPIVLGIQAIRKALSAKGVPFEHYRDRFETASEFEIAATKIRNFILLTVSELVDFCDKLGIVPGILLVDEIDAEPSLVPPKPAH
ncbi:hypothetical protein [Paenibacillus silagei]|uniref:Uncharacterized protein n=1 Tax=Paenibacillus silagei TaxID=1670801 RepID=A0ABS4NRU8_9BACL|nr:hypothetical protein [Paenibacillus silagei]MBP2112789.1 hypothetical protein [Paenibacillus silagei]